MAAGLKVPEHNLRRFREVFEKKVAQLITEVDTTPEILIDCEIALDDITHALVDEIESLEPFGTGNRSPLFRANHLQVHQSQIVGHTHRRMLLRQPGDSRRHSIRAIQFNVNPNDLLPDAFERVAFRLRWNRWNGKKSVQIIVEDTLPGE